MPVSGSFEFYNSNCNIIEMILIPSERIQTPDGFQKVLQRRAYIFKKSRSMLYSVYFGEVRRVLAISTWNN